MRHFRQVRRLSTSLLKLEIDKRGDAFGTYPLDDHEQQGRRYCLKQWMPLPKTVLQTPGEEGWQPWLDFRPSFAQNYPMLASLTTPKPPLALSARKAISYPLICSVKILLLTVSMGMYGSARPDQAVPVNSQPPGGVSSHQVPQLIHITIDDAVNPPAFEVIQSISNHQNPDNRDIAFTFFVSLDYSDYWLVHKLYARGHEIGVHTMTHSTNTSSNFTTWVREIEGCREALHRYAGIPREAIRGFRAPYLAYNADMFRALSNLGFSYDCSISEGLPGLHSTEPGSMIWPYTLHEGLQQLTDTGIGPTENYPSLMVVPMWKLFHQENQLLMDPWMNTGRTQEEILQLFKDNFTTRYEGNRVPLGIWLHPGWLNNSVNVDALNEFLEWALTHEDVWVVPVGKLVDWVYNPIPAASILENGVFSTNTFDFIPESETFYNSFAKGNFRTVGQPAHAYPHPDTLYRTEKKTVVFNTLSHWEIGEMNPEGVYLVDLFLQTADSSQIETWEIEIDFGDNVLQYGWSDNGIQLSQPESSDPVLISGNAWNPALGGEPKNVFTFAFKGDSSTLKVGQATFWKYSPKVPVIEMLNTGNAPPLLRWNNVAPFYQLQGRESLTQGIWEDIQTLYGVSEANIPSDSTHRFFRVIAYP